jgi:hypothetical protein
VRESNHEKRRTKACDGLARVSGRKAQRDCALNLQQREHAVSKVQLWLQAPARHCSRHRAKGKRARERGDGGANLGVKLHVAGKVWRGR